MDISLNLYNMGLSTATSTDPLYSGATGCLAGLFPDSCPSSVLGFYLTFYNSNTATSANLFADAFVGFVEFSPIPFSKSTATPQVDNVLVALNKKSYTTAPSGKTNPDLALTNYGTDWTASAFNTLQATDGTTANEEEYVPTGDKIYKTQCDELWQITTTAVQCVRVSI